MQIIHQNTNSIELGGEIYILLNGKKQRIISITQVKDEKNDELKSENEPFIKMEVYLNNSMSVFYFDKNANLLIDKYYFADKHFKNNLLGINNFIEEERPVFLSDFISAIIMGAVHSKQVKLISQNH